MEDSVFLERKAFEKFFDVSYRYSDDSSGGQVKNPHRLPIRKISPRKSLPRLFSDGKVLRLPVLSSFQGSVKLLAGIAVSFYEAIDGEIEFIRMRAWNGLTVFDSLDSRYSLGYRELRL
ncbi:hypothetical protein CEXT_291691 [Caerostris extrusa]|uniref:Uncharacterized protein n=1 Tax=Caerostris extrusa TaxID=172846 RepID=A0AAV4WVK8_CAEEX|nr:hypothetical protein CEXT_291691 [Caerostris extrusa]